ncbi:MAG: hypothetical protein WCJ95_03625 [Mariniphaga sp.]
MKNKGITLFLIILAVIIVTSVTFDYYFSKPDELPENPYALNINLLEKIDNSKILYTESRNFGLNFTEPSGICFSEGQFFIVGDQKMQIIDTFGKLKGEFKFDQKPTCVYVSTQNIFVGFRKSVSVLNHEGLKMAEWNSFSDSSVITSLAEKSGILFVADAGKRIIRKFSLAGNPLGVIEGKTGNDQIHGFIIPSPYFDIAFNEDGELWVVNPGKHALENYTVSGDLRTWWKATSVRIEGFSGCCNPAHFAFLPDGSFVTSEKGTVRIKVYKPSGEFVGIVAAPAKFKENHTAPDLATDNQGNIYALDLDKKMIRQFVKKEK